MITLPIEDARSLVVDAMVRAGQSPADAKIIADHLIDCELRGLAYGGLSRAVTVLDRLAKPVEPAREVRVVKESPVSALLDGGNRSAYVVAYRATELAISKARSSGIGLVGFYDAWMSGMLSYYMEMVTRADLAGIAFASSNWRVAPWESSEPRFGTNPVAFGFPTESDPIIFDAGVSSTMVSEAVMHQRLGKPLPQGRGYDAAGHPSDDPAAVLQGAFTVWGGSKGSGLGMAVQLLGLLCNGAVVPPPHKDQCQLILAIDPGLLGEPAAFKAKAADYARRIRAARPLDAGKAPRVPFERSLEARRAALSRGTIEVAEEVYAALQSRLKA